MRKEINALVRAYAMVRNGCYEETWNKLYKLYNKVMGQNVKSRATKRGIRPIEVVEQDGNLEFLQILANNL